jgi:Uma2 family endonuclease
MQDPNRLTVEEFFAWQEHVEGRYELVDGHIVPHPDYVTLKGLAAPSNEHASVVASLVLALGAQLTLPCRVYAGPCAVVDRINANVPDVAVSCEPSDRSRRDGLAHPQFIFEILSPSTKRIDRGRKVDEYLAISSLEAYMILDPERRSISVYKADGGPETFSAGSETAVALADGITIPFSVFD